MDSFEINKIAGAVLGALFLVLGLGYVAESLFYEKLPDTPGYEIEIADADTGAVEEEEEVVDVLAMIALADPADGEKLTRGCVACHKFDKGGANGTGPALWDIMGRQIASVEGFKYSGALSDYAASAGEWSFDLMNQWLEAPKALVAGTSMSYGGMRKPEDRAALLAYLRTLSDAPIDLPAASDEAASVLPNEDVPADTASALLLEDSAVASDDMRTAAVAVEALAVPEKKTQQ